jgi:hypothetical protein
VFHGFLSVRGVDAIISFQHTAIDFKLTLMGVFLEMPFTLNSGRLDSLMVCARLFVDVQKFRFSLMANIEEVESP